MLKFRLAMVSVWHYSELKDLVINIAVCYKTGPLTSTNYQLLTHKDKQLEYKIINGVETSQKIVSFSLEIQICHSSRSCVTNDTLSSLLHSQSLIGTQIDRITFHFSFQLFLRKRLPITHHREVCQQVRQQNFQLQENTKQKNCSKF